MRKKLYAILLITSLLLSFGSAAWGEGLNYDSSLSFAEVKTHLLTLWSDYLAIENALAVTEDWAFDAVADFLASKTWDDLVCARAACSTAVRYLLTLEAEAQALEDLSDEEYFLLYEAGIDEDYQSITLESCAADVSDARGLMEDSFLHELEGIAPFSNELLDILGERLALKREEAMLRRGYVCCTANYLLLSLQEEEIAGAYWADMEKLYPALCLARIPWFADEGTLLAHVQEILDAYEAQEAGLADLLAKSAASLERLAALDAATYIDTMLADFSALEGLPALLPSPVWYDPSRATYLSVSFQEDDSPVFPAVGDTLDGGALSAYLSVAGVAREEIEAYLPQAAPYALDIVQEGESDTWYVMMPDYALVIRYDEGDAVTLLFSGTDATFAPFWYIA